MRHGPARLARHVTQALLQFQAVHLVHHAVDIERQPVALLADPAVKFDQPVGAVDHLSFLVDRKSERFNGIQQLAMPHEVFPALNAAKAVRREPQRPARGNPRIELPYSARRGVARVDEGLLARSALPLVHALEVRSRHVYLAADVEQRGRFPVQAQRQAADRAHVGCHVLAGLAVAARRREHESTVLIAQADRQAVELELGQVLHRRILRRQAELAADACIEFLGAARLRVGFGTDGEHRHIVAHGDELFARRPADALRRRIRRAQLRMALLQRVQLAEQCVVFRVGDLGRVLDVIEAVMALDRRAQYRGALARGAQEKRRSASGLPGSMPRAASRDRVASSSARMAASARSSSGLPFSSTSWPPSSRAAATMAS